MTDPVYCFAYYRLLPQQRALLADGTPVRLGGRAFDTLVALVERRDRTVGKNELLQLVWPRLVVEENNLQVQVMALRKLFGHAAIATVPGRGYRFTWPVVTESESKPADTPAPAGSRPVGNLPNRTPELLGRESELHTLREMIDQHAIVTVAGTGGIGKTRLAEGVAATLQPVQNDGVWWVELAALSDPALVAAEVARAMALPLEGQTDATQAVVQALEGRAALLVLDNAEHLLDGVAAFVAAVRQHAVRVKLLITSQEVLRTLDEQVFRPGPLSLPPADDLATVRASSAVALFVVRARAADPRFELGEHNRAAVADICRRLDGIPLAIELAAARLPLLGVEGVRQRLDERFQVLTAGHRAVLRRHQTLRAALEWSHGLLEPPEQKVFRRLGVFAGGFTLEAAQALAADDMLDGWEVLEQMGALVDKSLLVAEGDPLPRYRMLETTRLYALERLADAGETGATLLQHAQLFAEHAEVQDAEIAAHGAGAAPLARIDAERDNLMHALAWCQRADEPAAAALGQRLAGALRYWYTSRALLPLGLRQMQAALARAAALPLDVHRLKLLTAAAQAATWVGQHDTAAELGQQALEAARSCGDAVGEAGAHLVLGHCCLDVGRPDEAEQHLRAALSAGRTLGHRRIAGGALNGLAALAADQGRLDESWSLLRDLIEQRRIDGHVYHLVNAVLNGAMVALMRNDAEAARRLLAEAAGLLPQIDSRFMRQLFIVLVAPWLALQARWAQAVLFCGAASMHKRQVGLPALPLLDTRRQLDMARARAALTEAEFEAAWAEGAAMDPASLQSLALALLAGVQVDPQATD